VVAAARTRTGYAAGLLAGAAVAGAALAVAGPPARAEGTAEGARQRGEPVLTVGVTDGRDAIAPGEETRYTVSVRNEGSAPADGVVVSQSVPAEAHPVDAGQGGRTEEGVVTWRVHVAPGGEVTRTATVRLGPTGGEVWRVATTVCAQTDPDHPPVACAADANLVKGAAAGPAPAAADPPRPTALGTAAAAAVPGALAAGAVLALLLRARARRAAR
jgi:uncharacterized repeat protein (TIGR01451 family)